jgi:3D (Asp-Asp-Asp) domain-containing protein
MTILSKKDKKYFLIIILFSLIHNLIVWPAQAAEEYSGPSFTQPKLQKIVIKNPASDTKHFEELRSNLKNNTPGVVKNFQIIENNVVAKDSPKKDKITLLNNQAPTNNKGLKTVSLTAYNSEPGQTDNDPCTTANGFNLCKHGLEDSVAANFLPFGTKIMIPSLFGDRIFVVRDRMNKRFSNRVDVWMLKRGDAIKFGVRQAQIVILES